MQIQKKVLDPTRVKLTIVADEPTLRAAKDEVLARLAREVKVPGFRAGKVPAGVAEKHVDSSVLQSEVLDLAINRLYSAALDKEKLRPVAQPQVSITKFVPFTTLELTMEVDVVGDVTLPDYKKIKLAKKPVEVTAKDVDDVIKNLQTRLAEKVDVDRAAKDGDQVMIDFKGVDAKTKEPIQGADGKGYPLLLGSNTFIPGFEPNLVGLSADGEKTFTLEFPKDYGVKALQARKVTFTVTVNKVQEVREPKADDDFAAKAGPFKTLKGLKDDIKKQMTSEKQSQAERDYENELLEKLADKTKVAIPEVLINEELDRIKEQQRQNLTYRGQTWQEYLESMGKSEEEYRAETRKPAEMRVKVGLLLSEVADKEQITVTPEEFELRMQLYKGQYGNDEKMQAELEKPENKRAILSRMLTEKTLALLATYAQSGTSKK